MHIIVISGLSGAGKSIALHMLEDLGYYCIDNMPAALLKPFVSHTVRNTPLAQEPISDQRCVFSGEPAREFVLVGRSY